jgi:dihydroneopterin aldolase
MARKSCNNADLAACRGSYQETMDRILLSGVRCNIRVGVTPAERHEPQECLVDVEVEHDLSCAARSDDLHDTLDYSQVYDLIQRLSQDGEYALLERFAGRLEEELRRDLATKSLRIRVKKLHPPLAGLVDYAGIEIRRP